MKPEQQPVPHPTFEDRHGQTWYVWGETAVLPFVADMYVERARLTDAELAAEYWAAAEEATSHHFRATDRANEAQRIEGKLYDFARAPHAAESDYQ